MVYTVRREPFLSGRFGRPTRSVAVRSTDPVWEEGRRREAYLTEQDDHGGNEAAARSGESEPRRLGRWKVWTYVMCATLYRCTLFSMFSKLNFDTTTRDIYD